MFTTEARDLYACAYANARKTVNDFQKMSADPYLNEMYNEVDDSTVAERMDLGILEIPVRQIVGSASDFPEMQYTYDFMPLADANSEFAAAWCQLYLEYLSDKGLTTPIECVEYMGRFYVVDGKKRVSVLKAHGEIRVQAHVTRLVPAYSNEKQVKQYYEFMKCFSKTRLYQVVFSNAANFEKLQNAMGLAPEKEWTDMERYHFMFTFAGVERAYFELLGEYASVTAADVFVALLDKYSFSKIRAMLTQDLEKEIGDVLGLNAHNMVA